MPLDNVGRQYADKLYQQNLEGILKTQGTELTEVTREFAARGMIQSGAYFTAQVDVYLRNSERLAQARVDSLLQAYEKSGIPVEGAVVDEITQELSQFCEQHGRNILQTLQNRITQTFGGQDPGGLQEAFGGEIMRGVSGISARLRRKLEIMRDEARLAARRASQSNGTSNLDGRKAVSQVAPGPNIPKLLHQKPHLYYWRFFQEFGRECYRTWRWELLASLGVSFITFVITKGDDPLAWRNFKIAFLATILTLAIFAVWHLVRTPWLLHRAVNSAEEPTIHWTSGVFGVLVLTALVVGAYVSIGYLTEATAPPIVKILAPPPPGPMPQQGTKPSKQTNLKSTPSPGQPDRILNAQQSDHLYRKLKEFASDPKHTDLSSVTIAPYAYQDRETAHLAWQLATIFEDAHWKVLRQTQLPITLEGRTRNQIPIGIWIMTSHDQNFCYFLWSSLNDVGLRSEERPRSDLPTDFNGSVIWVGYKEAPIY